MESDNTVLIDRQTWLVARVVVSIVFSGLADAVGFIHSARAWQSAGVRWESLAIAGLCFAGGLLAYWLASHDMSRLGVGAPEIQALCWFVTTIVGVAAFSGSFSSWPALEQSIAVAIVAGLSVLIVRVG